MFGLRKAFHLPLPSIIGEIPVGDEKPGDVNFIESTAVEIDDLGKVIEDQPKNESMVVREQLEELQELLKKANWTSAELTKEVHNKGWKLKKWDDLRVWQYDELKKILGKAAGGD